MHMEGQKFGHFQQVSSTQEPIFERQTEHVKTTAKIV